MLRNKAWSVFFPLLATLAAPAFALDIDRIQVRSRQGQPLLAEIPVVADDPSELRRLRVRLASPATFARIGLERPRGVLEDLRFRLARDARGEPVIRVTSRLPVEQPFLTFLVQVEWGDGRLVREYSVALDDPGTLAAPALPPIEAPTVAPSNAIARRSQPASIPLAEPAPPVRPVQPAKRPQAGVEAHGVPLPRAAGATVTAAPATAAPSAMAPEGIAYGPVKAGDTMSQIARRFVDRDHSPDQVMLAFLRANPEAFVAGNINLVRRGAMLRAPSPAELSRYGAAQAAAMVREQVARWREGTPAMPQPPAPAPDSKAIAVRDDGPRLEISPPSGDAAAQQANRSDLQTTGAGDAPRPASASAIHETDILRDAQLKVLQARVAELERLQQRQQQLIALKDSELAARPASRAAWPWWLAALVLLPLSTWWWTRRRERVCGGDQGDAPASAQSPAWHFDDLDRERERGR